MVFFKTSKAFLMRMVAQKYFPTNSKMSQRKLHSLWNVYIQSKLDICLSKNSMGLTNTTDIKGKNTLLASAH
jgi:hypothetical protein